jgi:hypothetical protein
VRQRLIGIVTAGLGVLLLWIAVPRMVANLLLLPGNSALQLLTTGNTITLDGYDRILRSRDAALAWVELPQARIELGETLYLMARAEDQTGVDAGTALREARNQFRLGLAQAPASTRAWLWLADVNQALGDAEGAAAAVRLSLLSAPHEVNIASARAVLAFLYWDRLAPEIRAIAAGDVRTALSQPEAAEFIDHAAEIDRLHLVEELVTEDPNLSKRLATLLAKRQPAG